MNPLKISIIFMLFFAVPGMAGTVYKWVDENGTVHYGQRPANNSATTMNIRVKPSSESYDNESSEETEADASENSENDGAKSKSKEQVAWEKEQASIKKKNCEIATQRHSAMAAGGRVYEMKDGERHYIDDSARVAKLADARKSMNKWCN